MTILCSTEIKGMMGEAREARLLQCQKRTTETKWTTTTVLYSNYPYAKEPSGGQIKQQQQQQQQQQQSCIQGTLNYPYAKEPSGGHIKQQQQQQQQQSCIQGTLLPICQGAI